MSALREAAYHERTAEVPEGFVLVTLDCGPSAHLVAARALPTRGTTKCGRGGWLRAADPDVTPRCVNCSRVAARLLRGDRY